MDIVTKWDQVPRFPSEQAEAEFWLHHRVDARLMEQSVVGENHTESITITMRVDPRLLARVKRLARSRYLNYQSMIKQWISERLETELRDRTPR
jgi:predicted DNA binding CopG/RHH family protein